MREELVYTTDLFITILEAKKQGGITQVCLIFETK